MEFASKSNHIIIIIIIIIIISIISVNTIHYYLIFSAQNFIKSLTSDPVVYLTCFYIYIYIRFY